MSDSDPSTVNPLDSALSQLRSICDDRALIQSSIDAGSVRRMLTHIANINSSVRASTQDHVNAAKRLNDFAISLVRIARNSVPPNEALTTQMTQVAENLRAASDELTRNDSVPNWRAPATGA